MPRVLLGPLGLALCLIAVPAQTATAQLGSFPSGQTLELRSSGETMPFTRPSPNAETRGSAAPDSIWYDDGTNAPGGFIGFGSPTPFYAALRFTTSEPFTLTGLRMAYRTEASSNAFAIYVLDASGGNSNPSGGNVLFEGTSNALSPSGRFGEFTFNQAPPEFPAGSSFFIIAAFANVPYPMGTDDSGTGNYQGRSFFSGTGNAGDWSQLGDILGDGQPDVWKIRALGTSAGGGSEAHITVNPASLSTSLASGTSTTLSLSIGNTGTGSLTWSASTEGRGDGGDAIESEFRYYESSLAGTDGRDLLRHAVRDGGSARVIVRLDAPFMPEGTLPDRDAEAQRAGIAAAQEGLLTRMTPFVPRGVKRFQTVPYVAMVVDAAGLEALERDPAVIEIHEDRWLPPSLALSIPIIGANAVWAQGLTGAGLAVAVLDSGFEVGHPFLGGRTVAEACFSSSEPGVAQSLCPSGQQQQTGPGSAAACEATLDGCDHGTHVAGITLGAGTSFSGVARGANLIAIQVFTRVINQNICGSPQNTPCLRTTTSDQMLALEHVYNLRNTFSIAAVNMSLGGGQFSSTCDNEPQKPIIDNLRSVRIATVVSSGNEGFTNAMGSPACISSAISVGSTQNGAAGTVVDGISPFSNSSPVLDLLAPGQLITSSVLNGSYGPMAGTSMAAPHVAGAFAVLRQQRPQATVSELLATLSGTGVPITDPRNGRTRPRIQLDAAVGSGSGGDWLSVSPSSGTVNPGGSTTLNVSVSASGLGPGTYSGSVVISSNAANQSSVTVPVTLTVTGGSGGGILTHIGPSHTQNTFTTNVGGYVHGTNGYTDKAKAVAFELPGGATSGQLAGVNVYFSRRAATPVLQNYYVRIYPGTPQSGPQGSPIFSQSYSLASAIPGEPADATQHVFASPVTVGSTFFVSIDYPDNYHVEDFNIASTAALGAGSPFEWEMWDTGAWHNMSAAWHSGNNGWHMWVEAVMGETVSDEPSSVAGAFALHPNFPNPVGASTTIGYTLPTAMSVQLEVFDAIGRRVVLLEDGERPAGDHEARWDANGVAGGVYFYRLTAGAHSATRSLVVLR